jgi:hypothetical protein
VADDINLHERSKCGRSISVIGGESCSRNVDASSFWKLWIDSEARLSVGRQGCQDLSTGFLDLVEFGIKSRAHNTVVT